jgi:hypothetical protein
MSSRVPVAALLTLAFGAPAQAQFALSEIYPSYDRSLAPLYRDVVAGNPGVEMIQPLLDFTDADADGVFDSLTVNFNVFPVDGAASLFTTARRRVDFPRPCTNPGEYAWSEVTALRFVATQSPRAHVAIGLAAACFEADEPFTYKEGYKTVVHSAAVDQAGGTVWTKAYAQPLIGLEALDVDGDPASELVLGLGFVRPALPDGARNLRSIALDDADGSVVFDVNRAFTR